MLGLTPEGKTFYSLAFCLGEPESWDKPRKVGRTFYARTCAETMARLRQRLIMIYNSLL